jgi:hypothetical protein
MWLKNRQACIIPIVSKPTIWKDVVLNMEKEEVTVQLWHKK